MHQRIISVWFCKILLNIVYDDALFNMKFNDNDKQIIKFRVNLKK